MSVYRDPAGRGSRILAAVIVAALTGALVGFLIARASDEDPTLADQVAELRADVELGLSALELVPGHYRQGVRDGDVVTPAQYEGARAQAAAAADALAAAAPDLSLIAPDAVAVAEDRVAALQELISAKAELAEVERSVLTAHRALAAAAGISAGAPAE